VSASGAVPPDPLSTGPIMRPRRRPDGDSGTLAGNCLIVEVVTVSGRAAAVEFRILTDQVEVWHHLRRAGVFDRAALRQWLIDPGPPLAVDEVIFSVDRMIDVDGRVAISFPDVLVWPLSPRDLEILRRRI
jgi:hypothetical protein